MKTLSLSRFCVCLLPGAFSWPLVHSVAVSLCSRVAGHRVFFLLWFFNQHICLMLINSCANRNDKAASNLNFSNWLGKAASVEMLHLVRFAMFAAAVKLGGTADMLAGVGYQ